MSEVAKKKHNYCIDFIKGIACICVVFMHCEFPGRFGIFMQCISRFCVPFFFMVSGYFCYYEDERKFNSAKKLKHIGIITVSASLFYILFGIFQYAMGDNTLPTLKDFIYFITLNKPVFIVSQLWFLFALFYDYILFAAVYKFKLYKPAYIAIPILIICYICLAQGAYLLGFSFPNMIYRNFIIEGFPLFMFGHFIHKNRERIKISNKVLLIVVAVSTVLCIAERFVIGRDFGINIVTFPQVIALFLLGIMNPSKFENNYIRKLGTKYSMFVYILHPFVWHSLEYLYRLVNISENKIALYLMPVLVLCLTLALSKLCYTVINAKRKSA